MTTTMSVEDRIGLANVSSIPEELQLPREVETKLTADLKKAALTLKRHEARYLVDLYYTLQDYRIRSAAQIRSAEGIEPNALLEWSMGTFEAIEGRLKYVLGKYAQQWTVGKWMQSICGIGPVLSAGFLAHLDIRGIESPGKWWAFAGLDPTKSWDKGKKRPWNAKLKVLCYKAGESFVKVQNNDNDFYGKLFATRKKYEWGRNLSGFLAREAERALSDKKFDKSTMAYKYYAGWVKPQHVKGYLDNGQMIPQSIEAVEGAGVPMLPPAHIHARARRYAVKMFISHIHHVMFTDYHDGIEPNLPYILQQQEHTHFIAPPNWPLEKGGRPLKEMFE